MMEADAAPFKSLQPDPMARGARDVARRCIADPLSLIDSPEHLLNQAGAALLIRRSSKSSVSKIG